MNKNEMRELDTRQQCREKLPIWFGSRSNHYHGLLETMMNANDEMTTHPSPDRPFKMKVGLEYDGKTVFVEDHGRGIKLLDTFNDKPIYQVLFETLFAGTNFDNAELGKETTGTNGCGLTVLNHTSEMFQCTSVVGEEGCVITYADGGLTKEINQYKPDKSITKIGTTFRFRLDPEMYTQTTFNESTIREMCNHLAGISNGLEIEFFDYGTETLYTYKYESLGEYMKQNCTSTIGEQYEFNERTESESLKTKNNESIQENNRMKLIWSIGTDTFQETYLNCTYLRENGTIYDGVVDGFKKVFDKYSDKKIKITASDIELGLNFVCGLWTNNVEFANQTKFSTKKESYKKHITKYVVDNLEAFRLENPKQFDVVLNHFVDINNFNKKAENDIKQLKTKIQKKQKGTLSQKIEGLVDCDMRNSKLEERILVIDEGKSANHTLISSRDPRVIGCIGLRGRFINSFKTSATNVFKNEEAMAIMAALGCGIELPEKERKRLKDVVSFDESNLRYGSIAIICDADGPGKAITLSLLCFFYKFYPTLCEQGRIYTVKSPRFIVHDKKANEYCAYNEEEKSEIVAKLGKDVGNVGIVKGLGELSAERFWNYVLCPEIREKTFVKVDWSAFKEDIDNILEITMGERIDERKAYIMKNVVEAKLSLRNIS